MAFVLNKIILTGLTVTDEHDIVVYMQDPEISEGTSRIPFPYTIEHAKTWVADNLAFEKENGYRRNYAIRDEAGKMLGCIGLHFNYGKEADKSEFGYWLGRPYRNRGIMTGAIKMFATLAKQQYKLKTLEAHVFDFNIASQRALIKSGFTAHEHIANLGEKNGQIMSGVKFVLEL